MKKILPILVFLFSNPVFAVNTYVGIGTTSPGALLHLKATNVAGRGQLTIEDATFPQITLYSGSTTTTNLGSQFLFNPTGGITQIQGWNGTNGTASTISLNPNGGNVGIGTTSPQLLLNVGATPNLDVTGTLPIITLHSTTDVKKEASIYNHSSGLYFDSTGAATATNNQIYFRTTNSSAANSTGLFNAMVISSVGNITMPAQSSFEAKLCSSTINAPSTVVWETVLNNIGSNYSSGTGIYTAPVTGVYSFGFNTLLSFTGSGEYRIEFWKNGGLYDSIIQQKAVNTWQTIQGTITTKLNAGDTMKIYYSTGAGAVYTDCNYNRFWGRLEG